MTRIDELVITPKYAGTRRRLYVSPKLRSVGNSKLFQVLRAMGLPGLSGSGTVEECSQAAFVGIQKLPPNPTCAQSLMQSAWTNEAVMWNDQYKSSRDMNTSLLRVSHT